MKGQLRFILLAFSLATLGCNERLTSQKQIVYTCDFTHDNDGKCKPHGSQGVSVDLACANVFVFITPTGEQSSYKIQTLVKPRVSHEISAVEINVELSGIDTGGDEFRFGVVSLFSPLVQYSDDADTGGRAIRSWFAAFSASPPLDPELHPTIHLRLVVEASLSDGRVVAEECTTTLVAKEIIVPSSLVMGRSSGKEGAGKLLPLPQLPIGVTSTLAHSVARRTRCSTGWFCRDGPGVQTTE